LLVRTFNAGGSPSEFLAINGTFMAGLCLSRIGAKLTKKSNYRVAIKDLIMPAENPVKYPARRSSWSMSVELQDLRPWRGHRAGVRLRHCALATLLLPFVLLGCSSVALPQTDAPPAEPNAAAFHKIIGAHLKAAFKEIETYDSFEISDARWVHTVKGWSWLNCVRFQDRNHIRTYAVFIQTDKVVDSRYAVTTDGCGGQAYAPFDDVPVMAKPSNGVELDPLH
jgi:hypothetical protein